MVQFELFDAQKLQYICDNFEELEPTISKHSRHDSSTTKKQITAFLSMSETVTIGNTKEISSVVTYRQRLNKGRFFANHSYSLQGIARPIRHTVANKFYYDMDISNAHPVILLHMCSNDGLEVPHLKSYVNDRSNHLRVLSELGIKLGKTTIESCEEWAKKQYLKITNFGLDDRFGEPKKGTNEIKTYTDHCKLYMDEMRRLHDHFSKKNSTEFELFVQYKRTQGKETNFAASYMNFLMCEWENRILQKMIKSFGRQTYDQDSDISKSMQKYFIPCFDGVMIPKKSFDGVDLTYDIELVEKLIQEELTIKVKISNKSMNYILNIPIELPEYNPLELNSFGDYKLISGNPDKVYDKSTIDRWIKNNVFLLESSDIVGGDEKFKLITKHVKGGISMTGGGIQTRETYTDYHIDDTKSIVKSLNRYCNIINPEYDPELYANNKETPKTREIWNDIRMKPYLCIKANQPFTLGEYIEEKKKRGEIEEYSGIEFIPTLNPSTTIINGKDKIFNTFKGFPWVGKSPEITHNIEKSHFYHYLQKYFFKNNITQFNLFLDWIADMFLDPTHLKPYTPVIIGEQGTLKSELGKFLTRLLGKHNAITIINTDRYFGQFNSISAGRILQIFEELSEGKMTHSMKNRLKGEITDEIMLKEGKRENQKEVNNFSRKMFISNFDDVIDPENKERRFKHIVLDSSAAGNVEIITPVIKEINDENYVISFFEWIIRREYNPENLHKSANTDETNSRIIKSLPQAFKFIINFIERTFPGKIFADCDANDSYTYRFSSVELNREFRSLNPKVAEDTLKNQLAKIGVTAKSMRITSGGNPIMGYILYPPHIEESIRKLTGVNTFKLNLNVEENSDTVSPEAQMLDKMNKIRYYESEILRLKKEVEMLSLLS